MCLYLEARETVALHATCGFRHVWINTRAVLILRDTFVCGEFMWLDYLRIRLGRYVIYGNIGKTGIKGVVLFVFLLAGELPNL